MRLLLSAVGAAVLALVPAGAHRIRPLGHANPGGGYTGDVFVHRGFAYLSSWHGTGCPAQGVRVYDLRKPSSGGAELLRDLADFCGLDADTDVLDGPTVDRDDWAELITEVRTCLELRD